MANGQDYRIILNKISDEKTLLVVVDRLSKLTKQAPDKVKALADKAPVVIFKSVDKEKAETLKKYLGGAIVVQQNTPEAAAPTAAPKPQAPKPAAQPPKPAPKAAAPSAPPQPKQPVKLQVEEESSESANASLSLGFESDEGAKTPPPKPAQRPAKMAPEQDKLKIEEKKSAEDLFAEDKVPAAPSMMAATPAPTKATAAPKEKKKFKDNYVDHSDEKGYAYEFFCEICNKAYRPEYFVIPSGIFYIIALFFKFIGMKMSGKHKGSFGDLKESEKKNLQRTSLTKSMKHAESHFLKCSECGLFVCASCWNPSQKKCTNCQPVKTDDLPIHERKKREKEEREKAARMVSRFCPGCGAEKKANAKFCDVCGASYE